MHYMKNSQNFKTFWWGILVIVIGYYLFGRYTQLINGKPSYFDVVVFIIWIGICLAPIFQEMEIFGVKLKQKIEELKKDLSYQLSIMQSEIKSSIAVSNANSNQIYFQAAAIPPKDSEIPDLSEQIQTTLKQMGIAPTQNIPNNYGVTAIHIEMFKVRLAFENLLRKYTKFDDEQRHSKYPITMILNRLRENESISKRVLIGVREVMSVCNYAIHGESLTNTQIDFVRDSAPGLLEALSIELQNIG